MNNETLKKIIDNAFDDIINVNSETKGEVKDAVEETLNLLLYLKMHLFI